MNVCMFESVLIEHIINVSFAFQLCTGFVFRHILNVATVLENKVRNIC